MVPRFPKKTLIFFIGIITLFPRHSFTTQIVAIVGDSVVTDYEVSQRARIIALLKDIKIPDQETLKRIEREIIPILIDEEIKKDYARRVEFKISPEIVQGAILAYAKQKGKKDVEGLKKYILSLKIDWDIFEQTIMDEITWSHIVYGGIAQQIQVSESEIAQRAMLQNIDISNPDNFNRIKQEIVQERLLVYVGKIISQMKRFNIIESVN
jgi:hypothetical protein